ncbi:lysylphosphatidylglycerol synthase transmembrane domain-containing protein [Tamlana sp. 2_MG-2023]|uniref:lysylphosphatidylglycerol synthase transmembrane domain-containing protein n=1 Tax=unclassified Tamlana TaxID=2614803 RepID=UPI0026E1298D|nr:MULTISPECIES: lysylphosphatidylglycerol synthase transmembrane domain-containing protein [unclassified Tamlana]MDO6760503.1 lysylphosphatidylglycerol synthase transmembrane domain-containing protein [Tamlana sp. 2_MG-2023]MDO6790759.1 lysylphosphatidylglycerol synthase transmembrane domain-containing protein [Tamlana sp. 1_MG-2023]
MNQNIKNLLKIVLPLLLGVFLIWYSLSKVSIDKLLVYAKNADYTWIVFGMFLGLLSHMSRAYRWRFMLTPMGYHVKFGNSFMAVFAAYLINYTIPRAGEVARASLLANYEGVPFEKGFGTIVAERIADMIVMLGIMTITLFLQFDFIYGFLIQKFNPVKVVLAMFVAAVIFIIAAILIRRSSSKIALKIKNFVGGLIEGALSIFKMKNKWAYIFHTLFIWGMYVLMFYVTTFAIKELGVVSPGAILVGFISASFSIAATNGGIGSYPLAVFAAFSLFGIPEEPSIAYGWIMWASQTLVIIVCGGLSLIYLPIYNRINKK